MTEINSQKTAIATAKKLVVMYCVVSAIVLATVAAVAIDHGDVSAFMWIRAGILLLAGPMIYRWVIGTSQGSGKNLRRLRIVSLVLPIAIVVVDLIPGMCPPWYTVLQAISAVALIAVAVITRRGPMPAIRVDGN